MTAAAAPLLACALLATGCGASVPLPRTTDHKGETPITVPYPPPPQRVELIPAPPADLEDPVWIDGQWSWRSGRWDWTPGSWQLPPRGAAYAPPRIDFLPHGEVAWYPGRWRK